VLRLERDGIVVPQSLRDGLDDFSAELDALRNELARIAALNAGSVSQRQNRRRPLRHAALPVTRPADT